MTQNTLLERIKALYQQFGNDQIEQLDDIYADDVQFVDPFHEINGIHDLKQYFTGLCQNLNHCEFIFLNECNNSDNAFFQWQMIYSHPRIKGGAQQKVKGATFLEFNEKITLHRDYFDSADLLYRHLPVFGQVIKFIKKRMA